MSNVIQFPTSERVKQVLDEKIERVIDEEEQIEIQKEECVELAYYCFQLMDQAIRSNEFIDGFDDMDFLDENKYEMRDMSAIINFLAATFYRYKGIEHPFQEDLDSANIKLDELLGGPSDDQYNAELEAEIDKLLNETDEIIKESEEHDID